MTIQLYTLATPNGRKVHIFLEETGLAYEVYRIGISDGDQFKPEFLAISPNNKIPAIVDPEGPGGRPITLFESGAILYYLAEKTGHFLPADPHARYITMQWLFWQMGGVGPMFGQAHHFKTYAPEHVDPGELGYATRRFVGEANRLHRVLERQLAEHEYVAGNDYTIADMAVWPWVDRPEPKGIDLAEYPNVQTLVQESG